MKYGGRLVVSLTTLFLFATIYSAIRWNSFVPFSWTIDHGTDYGIVLDAGSHGTRLHLYAWDVRVQDPNKSAQETMSIPQQVFQAQNVPGIGTYVYDKPDRITEDLIKPLVEQVIAELKKRRVPDKSLNSIPIGLKATAGMRDVGPDVRAAAFANIRTYLSQTPFRFGEMDARTISGEEEGMFGWVATNNAAGTLFGDPAKSIGSLDMGGASAQIVFKPIHTSIIEDSYEVTLNKQDIRIYSHSYLGYGWGDALGRVTARMGVEIVLGHLQGLNWPTEETKNFTKSTIGNELVKLLHETGPEPLHLSAKLAHKRSGKAAVKNEDGKIVLEALNPCFPKGFDYMYDIPGLSYPDGRVFLDVDQTYMHEYMMTLGLGPKPVAVRDMGHQVELQLERNKQTHADFDESVPHQPLSNADLTREGGRRNPFRPFDGFYGTEQTKYVIHWIGNGDYEECRARAKSLFYAQPCFTHSCSFNGIYQPRIEGSPFKGFGQYSKVVEALGVPSNPSLRSMEEKVAQVCNLPYAELSKNAKDNMYGLFTEKKVHKLCWKALWSYTFLTDGLGFPVDSQAITFAPSSSEEGSWALGSMIYEVNRLPVKVMMGRFKYPFYFSFTTAILACFSLYIMVWRNQTISTAKKGLMEELMYFTAGDGDGDIHPYIGA